jgi:hypothetical protein
MNPAFRSERGRKAKGMNAAGGARGSAPFFSEQKKGTDPGWRNTGAKWERSQAAMAAMAATMAGEDKRAEPTKRLGLRP